MAPQFKPARMRKVPRCLNCGVRPRWRIDRVDGQAPAYKPFCLDCLMAADAAVNHRPMPPIDHTEPR